MKFLDFGMNIVDQTSILIYSQVYLSVQKQIELEVVAKTYNPIKSQVWAQVYKDVRKTCCTKC